MDEVKNTYRFEQQQIVLAFFCGVWYNKVNIRKEILQNMTREDAYYKRIMLLCGLWDNYDEWLDSYLESENPISNIVLELLDCRGNMKEIEYRLNLYCLEAPFDEKSVYDRLRLYLRDGYKNGSLTEDEVMSALNKFSHKLEFCSFGNQCACLSDYYDLAENNILGIKRVREELNRWLDNGGQVDTEFMMSGRKQKNT